MTVAATSLGTPANGFLTSGVSLTCAVASAIGDTVVVVTADVSTGNTVGTLTDSKGNTYVKQAQKNTNANTSNSLWAIWTSVLTAALTTSDTISYVFHTAGTGGSIDALKVTGATSSPVDLVVTPTAGNSTAPSITSGIPSQSGEMFIAAVGFAFGADTGSQGSGWAAPPAAQTGASSIPCIIGGNQVNAGTGTLTYNPTVGTARAWCAFMISFKAIVAVTMTASAGSFAEAGEPITFATKTPAAVGSFAETGEAATFKKTVPLGFATYALTGEPATFSSSSQTIVSLALGSFTETGEAVVFGTGAPCGFGSFALTGIALGFTTMGVSPLTAGSYQLTGEAVTFVNTNPWPLEPAPSPDWTVEGAPSPAWANAMVPSTIWS